jgi:uncharacterized protein (TIGR02391 family)
MSFPVQALIPDSETLLALEVEELAGVLLMHLNSRGDGGAELHHYNVFNDLRNSPVYPTHKDEVNRALMEAWDWLANEGFLARRGDDASKSAFFVTRRGKRLKSREDLAAYRKANLLPRGQLHPAIAIRVYPAFLRGEYDTAVFQAFREVEVAVRQAGYFPADSVGVNLIRAAFRRAKDEIPAGPLVDTELPIAEQEAISNLFTGAIGLYKNPQSHRHVSTNPEEAAEVIMFASQLMRLVDRQRFRILHEMGAPVESAEIE